MTEHIHGPLGELLEDLTDNLTLEDQIYTAKPDFSFAGSQFAYGYYPDDPTQTDNGLEMVGHFNHFHVLIDGGFQSSYSALIAGGAILQHRATLRAEDAETYFFTSEESKMKTALSIYEKVYKMMGILDEAGTYGSLDAVADALCTHPHVDRRFFRGLPVFSSSFRADEGQKPYILHYVHDPESDVDYWEERGSNLIEQHGEPTRFLGHASVAIRIKEIPVLDTH